MKVVWSDEAKKDLEKALADRAAYDLRSAATLLDRISERVGQLSDFPEIGPVSHRRPALRQLVVTGTPYLVFYQRRDRMLRIIALVHASQSD